MFEFFSLVEKNVRQGGTDGRGEREKFRGLKEGEHVYI